MTQIPYDYIRSWSVMLAPKSKEHNYELWTLKKIYNDLFKDDTVERMISNRDVIKNIQKQITEEQGIVEFVTELNDEMVEVMLAYMTNDEVVVLLPTPEQLIASLGFAE